MNLDPVSPITPLHTPAPHARKNTRRIVALWLLIGPTALITGSIAAYAALIFISNATAPVQHNGEPYWEISIVSVILNILMLSASIIGITMLLPGLIIGILLLAPKKETHANN